MFDSIEWHTLTLAERKKKPNENARQKENTQTSKDENPSGAIYDT